MGPVPMIRHWWNTSTYVDMWRFYKLFCDEIMSFCDEILGHSVTILYVDMWRFYKLFCDENENQ